MVVQVKDNKKLKLSCPVQKFCSPQLTRIFLPTGPVFGSKNFFSGLAIFFDTYSNQNGEHAVGFFCSYFNLNTVRFSTSAVYLCFLLA